MPKYVVQHGSVKLNKKFHGVGSTLELTAEQVQEMDPAGERLVTPEVWAEQKKAEEALKKAAELKAKASKPGEPSKSEPTKK